MKDRKYRFPPRLVVYIGPQALLWTSARSPVALLSGPFGNELLVCFPLTHATKHCISFESSRFNPSTSFLCKSLKFFTPKISNAMIARVFQQLYYWLHAKINNFLSFLPEPMISQPLFRMRHLSSLKKLINPFNNCTGSKILSQTWNVHNFSQLNRLAFHFDFYFYPN